MLGECQRCHQEKEVRLSRESKQLLCDWCQRQARPLQRCAVCGHDRPDVYPSKQTGELTCSKCYKRNHQPRLPCSKCGHTRVVAYRDEQRQPVCLQCARHGKFRERCSICGQKRMVAARTEADEPICSLCQQTFKRLVDCVQCQQRKPMGKKLGPGRYLCHTCLGRNKKGICPICHHERTLANRLNGQLVCRMCKWDSQLGICRKCQRARPLVVDGYCGGCYGKIRRERTALRIAAIAIGMVVYHLRTTEHGRVKGIRTPVNKKGRPDVLRTQLFVIPATHKADHDIVWPAIHCRTLKHKVRTVHAESDATG